MEAETDSSTGPFKQTMRSCITDDDLNRRSRRGDRNANHKEPRENVILTQALIGGPRIDGKVFPYEHTCAPTTSLDN